MIKIALCLNDQSDAVLLCGMLKRRFAVLGADASILSFSDSGVFEKACDSSAFTMMFFDTSFDGGHGLNVAMRMRELNIACPIVFLSVSSKMALNCFSVHPAGYYIKPIKYSQLTALLDWHKGLFAKSCRSLSITSQRIPRNVFQHDIVYISVSGRTATLMTALGNIQTNRSLSDLSSALEPGIFAKSSRNAMVNLDHVSAIDGPSLTLDNGEILSVSLDRMEEFMLMLHQRNSALDALYCIPR